MTRHFSSASCGRDYRRFRQKATTSPATGGCSKTRSIRPSRNRPAMPPYPAMAARLPALIPDVTVV
jgi:hypothetical protein